MIALHMYTKMTVCSVFTFREVQLAFMRLFQASLVLTVLRNKVVTEVKKFCGRWEKLEDLVNVYTPNVFPTPQASCISDFDIFL